jgi:hypothetical protein
MKGMAHIEPGGMRTGGDLRIWLERAVRLTEDLTKKLAAKDSVVRSAKPKPLAHSGFGGFGPALASGYRSNYRLSVVNG